MSGAAGIAAAKNRRSKPDPSRPPIISCTSKSGSCPLPSSNKGVVNQTNNTVISPNTMTENNLQITTPMHFMQVIGLHEQRLNKIDNKITQLQSLTLNPLDTQSFSLKTFDTQACEQQACEQQTCQQQACDQQGCGEECYERLSTLEEKVHMLEEVIMNLQLTLTNVQSFAMETSLAMMKLQNQTHPTTPVNNCLDIVAETNIVN